MIIYCRFKFLLMSTFVQGHNIGKRPFLSRLQNLFCSRTLSEMGVNAKEISRNWNAAMDVFVEERNEQEVTNYFQTSNKI